MNKRFTTLVEQAKESCENSILEIARSAVWMKYNWRDWRVYETYVHPYTNEPYECSRPYFPEGTLILEMFAYAGDRGIEYSYRISIVGSVETGGHFADMDEQGFSPEILAVGIPQFPKHNDLTSEELVEIMLDNTFDHRELANVCSQALYASGRYDHGGCVLCGS